MLALRARLAPSLSLPRLGAVVLALASLPAGLALSAEKAPKAAAPAARPATAAAAPTAAAPAATPAPAAPAPAASFDELYRAAVPVKDLATLLEPLYARCDGADDKDDIAQRQCEGSKRFLLDYLNEHTFVAESDVPPDTSPYDAVAKQVDMEVAGCVACAAPYVVAGEPRYVTTRPPQKLEGGRASVAPVASHEIQLEDRTKADRFVERVVPRLRVQHVFKIGMPYGDLPTTAPAAKPGTGAALKGATAAPAAPSVKGVQITSLGHRVYDRCTGQIAAAAPGTASAVKVAPDRTCPRRGSDELSAAEIKRAAEIAALPERLTPRQIDQVLAPVQAKIHECYEGFGEPSGTAKVGLVIGGEGKLTGISLPPPFDKADIGVCIRSQLKAATFPKFRGGTMSVDYVYQVN